MVARDLGERGALRARRTRARERLARVRARRRGRAAGGGTRRAGGADRDRGRRAARRRALLVGGARDRAVPRAARRWPGRPSGPTGSSSRGCARGWRTSGSGAHGAARPARRAVLPSGPALRIDIASLELDPVPLDLGGWHLAVLDSGSRHDNAASGYNERRAECRAACAAAGRDIAAPGHSRRRAPGFPRRSAAGCGTWSARTRAWTRPSARSPVATCASWAICSMRRTRACATSTRSRCRSWSAPCANEGRRRGRRADDRAAASAARCSDCFRPVRSCRPAP